MPPKKTPVIVSVTKKDLRTTVREYLKYLRACGGGALMITIGPEGVVIEWQL